MKYIYCHTLYMTVRTPGIRKICSTKLRLDYTNTNQTETRYLGNKLATWVVDAHLDTQVHIGIGARELHIYSKEKRSIAHEITLKKAFLWLHELYEERKIRGFVDFLFYLRDGEGIEQLEIDSL